MLVSHCLSINPLEPDEVNRLRDIIRDWSRHYGCSLDGRLAQDRARKLILAYAAGIRDTKTLRDLIRPF